MKKTKQYFLSTVAVLAAIFGVASATANVHAADNKRPSYNIQVAPGSQRITIEAGQQTEGSFKVQNIGTKNFKFRVYATPFNVIDNKYSLSYDQEDDYSKASKWITFSQDTGELEPNKSISIKYYVDAPKDMPGGSQRAALMAEIIDDSEGNTIKTVSRIGMLLYADTKGGHTRIEGKILDVSTPTFSFSPKIATQSTLRNTGNVDIFAHITTTVRNFFGNELVYSNDDKPSKKNILAGTEYINSATWDSGSPIGIYKYYHKIELTTTTGLEVEDETNPHIVEKIVIVCPMWLIIIILAIIFFIVFSAISKIKSRGNKKSEKKKE